MVGISKDPNVEHEETISFVCAPWTLFRQEQPRKFIDQELRGGAGLTAVFLLQFAYVVLRGARRSLGGGLVVVVFPRTRAADIPGLARCSSLLTIKSGVCFGEKS